MMTIDEDVLRDALHEGAATLSVSNEARERILVAASSGATVTTPRHDRTRHPLFGHGRSILVSVAAGVVVLAIAVPLLRGESAPAKGTRDASANTPLTVTGFSSRSQGGANAVHGSPVAPGTLSGKTVTATGTSSTNSGVSATAPRVEEVGTVKLSVPSTSFARDFARLSVFAGDDGGFVARSVEHVGNRSSGSYSRGSIVLQVPEHNFARLVSQSKAVGVATSVETSSTDVTGQYVDLQARISALEVSRAQYLTIMTRAGSISAILAVQNQLNNVQSQIEQLQSQLKLLNTATTYATLTVSLVEAGHVATTTHPRSGWAAAWHDSTSGFVSGLEWLVRLAGPVLFALLLLAVLLALSRWGWRARERRRL